MKLPKNLKVYSFLVDTILSSAGLSIESLGCDPGAYNLDKDCI